MWILKQYGNYYLCEIEPIPDKKGEPTIRPGKQTSYDYSFIKIMDWIKPLLNGIELPKKNGDYYEITDFNHTLLLS